VRSVCLRASACPVCVLCVPAPPGVFEPVKRHRGEPGHTRVFEPVKRHRLTYLCKLIDVLANVRIALLGH
jgi:hypothetical protein